MLIGSSIRGEFSQLQSAPWSMEPPRAPHSSASSSAANGKFAFIELYLTNDHANTDLSKSSYTFPLKEPSGYPFF